MAGLPPFGPILERGADLLGRQAPTHRRLRRAGVHDRGPHASAFQLHLEVGDHRDERRLGGAVGAHVRPLAQCHIGADEDQVAALPVEHAWQHRGGQPVSADEVDLQLRLELVGGDLGELAEVGVARAGHQHLDLAKRVDRLRNKGFHRVGIGDVEVEADRLTAVGIDLAHDVVELLDPACAQGDGEAVCRELDGGGFSDAGGGAGHDCRPTFGQGGKAGHLGDLQGHR